MKCLKKKCSAYTKGDGKMKHKKQCWVCHRTPQELIEILSEDADIFETKWENIREGETTSNVVDGCYTDADPLLNLCPICQRSIEVIAERIMMESLNDKNTCNDSYAKEIVTRTGLKEMLKSELFAHFFSEHEVRLR